MCGRSIQRNYSKNMPAFVLEKHIAGILENVNIVPGELAHRTERQAELLRVQKLGPGWLEVIGQIILLFDPGPGLIGNFAVRRVDNSAGRVGWFWTRLPGAARPGSSPASRQPTPAQRILQAAHSVDDGEPEAFHFRLAIRRVLRPMQLLSASAAAADPIRVAPKAAANSCELNRMSLLYG
jgi:hypothetical protein